MQGGVLSLAAIAAWILTATLAFGQESAAGKPESITLMIRQMAGTWEVQSKMWPAPNATAVDLPPAIARREVIRNTYLQEMMDLEESTHGVFDTTGVPKRR